MAGDGPGYGLHFTDKDLSDLPKLNFYELQHALYAAFRAYDHTTGDERKANKDKVEAIYEEYKRRGITQFKAPVLAD
jgi:hypothetical protein